MVRFMISYSNIVQILANPMKPSLRPLFTIVLLIAIGTTLSCRRAVHWSSIYHTLDDFIAVEPPKVFINSTLVKYAEIEIGEFEYRQQIDELLEGNFGDHNRRYRSISSLRRFNHVNGRFKSTGFPAQLHSSKLLRMWPEFRKLLRDWFHNKRFQPHIMSELIDRVKRPLDQHYGFEGSDQPYGSCAVVGNSGILMKNAHGGLIDSHEIVIRLNNARVSGYQRNVGSKTHISFVNSNILHLCARRETCFCHPYGERVAIVMYICQAVHFMDFAVCNSSHKAPLLVTDAGFDVMCTRIVKYYSLKRFVEETGKRPEDWGSAHDGSMFHYSSGMQAVMLALGICEKVSVFGFGKSALAKHHYHTNQKAELHLHDYEAEYAFYRDLVERPHAIPFLKDSGFKVPPVVIYH